ncbi:MAG: hypothetical protein ACYC5X_11405 [Syntrophales bacterium]
MRKIVGLIVVTFLLCGFGLAADLVQAAAPAPIKWKLQSANPAGTPHIDLLNRLASNVDKMSAGRLKIEVLASGAIVNPFEILDGVNKGGRRCRAMVDPLFGG